MTEPDPTYSTNGDDDNTAATWRLALRSELISAIIQIERELESTGVPVKTAIVTRRERRSLTRRRR